MSDLVERMQDPEFRAKFRRQTERLQQENVLAQMEVDRLNRSTERLNRFTLVCLVITAVASVVWALAVIVR